MNELKAEEKLILSLIKLELTDSEVESVEKNFISKRLNWGYIARWMFEHRVAMVVYKNLLKYNWANRIPGKWRHLFEYYYLANRERNKYIYEAITPVLNDLYENKVHCIALKGLFLNHMVYNDLGLRQSKDIDLFFPEDELALATDIILKHGFIQGEIDRNNGQIIKATRKEKIFRKMISHELISFIKKTNNQFCEYIEIDVQYDIFSHAKRLRVPFNTEVLHSSAKLLEINKGKGRCYQFKEEYNLLQLCSHLYQDSVMFYGILQNKDHELSKYMDIYEFVKHFGREISWNDFSEELIENKVNHIVYFALAHAEQIYGVFVPEFFSERIKPKDLQYLNQFGVEEKNPLTWTKPFIERIFDDNKWKKIGSDTSAFITESVKNYMYPFKNKD